MIDFITGEKFKEVGDFTYSPGIRHRDDYDGLQNTFNKNGLKDLNIVYTHTIYAMQLLDLISYIGKEFIVITHNADVNIDESFIVPGNVKRWFAQNVNVINDKIESIPIGLENDRWFKHIRKKEKMEARIRTVKQNYNLVYMNHNIKTNPSERELPYRLFGNRPWVTSVRGVNGSGFDQYLDNVYNHKFMICPRGNGMDTHRLWECLYMGTVPIVKKDINNWFYNRLPILYVDEWEDVNEGMLIDKLPLYETGNWNKEMLTFNYWKNHIQKWIAGE